MNTVRKMSFESNHNRPKKTKLYVVSTETSNEERILVAGKLMSKYELNEKLAYFYEHVGTVMDI